MLPCTVCMYIFHFYIEIELEVHFYIELELETHFYIELELDVHFYIELELEVHFYIELEGLGLGLGEGTHWEHREHTGYTLGTPRTVDITEGTHWEHHEQ